MEDFVEEHYLETTLSSRLRIVIRRKYIHIANDKCMQMTMYVAGRINKHDFTAW